MKITFLGTGTSQGVPVIACECPVCRSLDVRDKRLRTSVFVETEELSLVIDTGPDFRRQMLDNRIGRLDAVLFTHEHKDHTAGMDDIRAFNFKQKKDMPVYGRQSVLDQLRREFEYIFAETKYPGVPAVELYPIENQLFTINNVPILPIEVMHYKLPVFGFRFGDFTYVTDANFISDKEMEKIRGTKVLVLNALRKEEHISHFSLEQALEIARQSGAEQIYLTHLSHAMGKHAETEAQLPANVRIAYDGLQLHF